MRLIIILQAILYLSMQPEVKFQSSHPYMRIQNFKCQLYLLFHYHMYKKIDNNIAIIWLKITQGRNQYQ